jgi:DNA-binding response OmpR family regulator
MDATDELRGLRVLIAEDNFLIGDSLRELVISLGCAVVGPIPDLDEVMAAIGAGDIDAALLDIQLGDADVVPAADELFSRGIPFIVTTGAASGTRLPEVLAQALRLHKPFDATQLEAMMVVAFLPRDGGARPAR